MDEPSEAETIEILKGVRSAYEEHHHLVISDEALEAAGFFRKLDAACAKSGKTPEAFAIIVKPNFMFMYSTKDRSTYTDPQLVERLMDRMQERGYRNLACAEARSTYGTFFTNREVKTVARHIGLTEKNYHLIDLSEDLEEYIFSGKLGRHYGNDQRTKEDSRSGLHHRQ